MVPKVKVAAGEMGRSGHVPDTLGRRFTADKLTVNYVIEKSGLM